MSKQINLKLRHKRKVIRELSVSIEEFKNFSSPTNEQLQDLDDGYKVQGNVVLEGYKITYVATKYFQG